MEYKCCISFFVQYIKKKKSITSLSVYVNVLQGGDADANGAVAGALLGCKLGLDAIPRTWVENLVHRLWLDELIDQ